MKLFVIICAFLGICGGVLPAQNRFPEIENGTVLKWETKTYSQSAHITRNQIVYSVRVGDVVYQIARQRDKAEMFVGERLRCRVDKDHFFVLDKNGKETKYDIVGTEQAEKQRV